MKKYIGLVWSLIVNFGASYAALVESPESTFIMNLFIGLSIIMVPFTTLMIFGITRMTDDEKIQSLLEVLSKKKFSGIIKFVDKTADVVLLCVLFGTAHWFLGLSWFYIHIIATAYLKEAVKVYNKGLESDLKPAASNSAAE